MTAAGEIQYSNIWQAGELRPRFLSSNIYDTTFDVLIIGGGFTGCAAAIEAVNSGASVGLIEAHHIGYGASGRNVGLVNAGLWLNPNEVNKRIGAKLGTELNQLLALAPDTVFELIEKYGIECEAVRQGTLYCAHNEKAIAKLANRQQQVAQFNPHIRIIDRAELRAKLDSDYYYAALCDGRAGTINPYQYCLGLAEVAQRKGVAVAEQTGAQNMKRDGQFWMVTTDKGQCAARNVIVATNAYTENLYTPRFDPITYFQCATRPLSVEERGAILAQQEGAWDTAAIMSSFRFNSDNRLIIGAIGNPNSMGGNIHIDWASKRLRKMYPQLAEVNLEVYWSGVIAMSRNYIPMQFEYGPDAIGISGFSGRGIGPGTVLGQNLARRTLGLDYSLPIPKKLQPSNYQRSISFKSAIIECTAKISHLAK